MFAQPMGDLMLNKQPEQVLVFYRKGLLFAFNYSAANSLTNVLVPIPNNADYTVAMSTDDEKYGGWGQVKHMIYPSKEFDGQLFVELYMPARTAIVLKEGTIRPPKKVEKTPDQEKTSDNAKYSLIRRTPIGVRLS